MAQPRFKFWGWGYEGEALAPDEVRWLEGMWAHDYPAVVTVDMTRMNRVLHIDPDSQMALVQAGARSPELERQLKSRIRECSSIPKAHFQIGKRELVPPDRNVPDMNPLR